MTYFRISLPEEAIRDIAERAAAVAITRLEARGASSPYLNVKEAAEYLRCSPQRIYDLTSSGRLSKVCDGSRVLLLRTELDEYVAGPQSRRRVN